eukprot:CAMPEP_0184679932 /NCGR_PEP_ID=MMETSP0312-20130426/2807_1 /TAXON_ID=31354 /ORGANISM="Compsopogon coeruleus, Strain SAG 36.94" /LENGTH=138 /DNA_ID=CAMNT_0027129709 /DNA_START=355 /DNA_END=774 /DNA_ORIENTATION=-
MAADPASGPDAEREGKEENEEGPNTVIPDTLPDYSFVWAESGKDNCEQCQGKGSIACPVCEGSGHYDTTMFQVVSSATCRMCMGRRKIPCPTCKESVFRAVLWWDAPENDPANDGADGGDANSGDEDLPHFRWNDPPR